MTLVSSAHIRALVVEDQAPVRKLIAAYLEAAGYDVVTTSDGEEGWEAIHREGTAFDVVLLDRELPKLNGMEVLARMKADPALADIPVILETAADSRHEIAEGIRAGAYYYLTKPIMREVLVSLVASAVQDGIRYRKLKSEINRHTVALRLVSSGSFQFHTIEEGNALAVALAQACPKPSSRVIGLSELMINAVEHGNLGITYAEKDRLITERRWDEEVTARLAQPEYCGKMVNVTINRLSDRIEIRIKDEGVGFDWENYLDLDPLRASGSHGRGIALARNISFDAMTYVGCGNEVVATILLPVTDDVLPEIKSQQEVKQEVSRGKKTPPRAGVTPPRPAPSTSTLLRLQQSHGVTLSSHIETSTLVGGDMWGVRPLNDHRFALYLVDFMGHGTGAARNAFRMESLIDKVGPALVDPSACLGELNRILKSTLPSGQYATMIYGVMDIAANEFVYAGAGVPHPLVADLNSLVVTKGDGSGLPLGIDVNVSYVNRKLAFPKETLLFLYSDGLTDCGRKEGISLGQRGVVKLVESGITPTSNANPQIIDAATIIAPFLAIVPYPLADDMTVVCCVR